MWCSLHNQCRRHHRWKQGTVRGVPSLPLQAQLQGLGEELDLPVSVDPSTPMSDSPSPPASPSSDDSESSPSLPIRPSSTTPLSSPTHHARLPGGSSSARHPSFPSRPISLSRRRSEPNIRSVADQPVPHHIHHPLSSSASFSADRRPGAASSGASSGRGRGAESLQGVIPTQDLPPITAGDQDASPVERCQPSVTMRSRSSGVVGVDPVHSETAQTRLYSSVPPFVPTARSVTPVDSDSDSDNALHPISPASNSKTYSFVSLPGNAVRKRPRRRYDEIERLYKCSWPDCTKTYGTLNHLNAHVVMQRHGSKRSPNEFKELRKQWRKVKKDGSDRTARPEKDGGRFDMSSVQAALPESYERQPRPLPYGTPQLYGPRMPGPEMDHQLAVGQAMSRYPLSAETSSTHPKPLQQQHGYTTSGTAHTTPPRQGSPTPDHAHLPAHAAYHYKRDRQGQSWTPAISSSLTDDTLI
jgi:hypothetical protein